MPLSTWYQISNSNSSLLETATNSLKLLSTSTLFDQLPSSIQTTTSQATTTTTTTEEESTTKSANEDTTKSTKFTLDETTTLYEQLKQEQQEENKNGGDISDISSLGKIDLSAIVLEDGLMDESLDDNDVTFDVDDTENEIDDDTFK